MKVLICIPTKAGGEYLDRAKTCQETWLKDCPCDFRFFIDSETGYKSDHPMIRQKRMRWICAYGLANGYNFVFRVDSDAYIKVAKLLATDFSQYDYSGWHNARCFHAYASTGFFLSRNAMKLILAAEHQRQGDTYWGDIWTGVVLHDLGIHCHVLPGFLDGAGRSDWRLDELPEDWISVHPVSNETMRSIHDIHGI